MHSHLVSHTRSIVRAAAVGVFGILTAFLLHAPAFAQSNQTSANQQNSATAPDTRQTSTPNTQGTVISVPEDFAGMKLAPGFLLNVTVYDEPDFTGPTRVDNEGNVNLAFLKPIHVAGDTVGPVSYTHLTLPTKA